MKRCLSALALLLLGIAISQAQFGSFGDVPVEIEAEGETRFSGGVAIAENNVVIQYGATTIYCDYAEYNPETRDVLVKDNVRIYRDGQIFKGDRAVYNFETKQVRAADFRGESYPFKFAGESLSSMGSKSYMLRESIFTTSDSSQPDYHFKAKRVRIYPNDRVVFSHVTLYVGKVPVFYFPYLYQPIDDEAAFTLTPGYTSDWGAFLLTQYTFPITADISGKFRFDLRSERGVGVGFESTYSLGKDKRSQGTFRAYYADDASPEYNRTGHDRGTADSGRYRISLRDRTYITEDLYTSIDINKLSDSEFLQDFSRGEFRNDPQPDNVATLTKRAPNFAVSLIGRFQWNEFQETTERLPELVVDFKRNPLFNSPIFYEGETGIAQLRRSFRDISTLPNYEATRIDSLHQLLYPKTYFGWLSIVPRVGIRGTYYSESGGFESRVKEITLDSLLSGGPPRIQRVEETLIREDGSLIRHVLNAGVESSFKFSKSWDDLQAPKIGLNGLRHIVQPFSNLSFVTSSEEPDTIFQFDRYIPSTQLPPVDFPQFTTLDSISDWSILRLGVRNRLQTKRDALTLNWFEMETFVNVNFDEPVFPGVVYEDGTFSNLYNRLRFTPLPWFQLELDSQLPVFDSGFTQVNVRMNFAVTRNLRLELGERFIENNPYFRDSNLVVFGGYYRVNDNWGFSFRDQYEINDGVLESQRYELHRDLSSWVASLGVIMRDNRGEDEFGLLLTFTLKDFPQISLPLSVDPQGNGE